jgi:uncharacterized LabA/DUF88 family protein
MAQTPDHISMALFCDFENVALGVRDANYDKFDIKRVLEKLLLKGSIVVKKAYCDWERYKGFKATMHEANFELIEIPHVRQSGKNSADIRMVVDALDLCYTKSHVNTFVIISGDSDFSPLVSKLRENNKQVIGVGVKQSTSDLLIANCDEFIFYDDLVRDSQRRQQRGNEVRNGDNKEARDAAPRRSPEEERKRKEEMAARRAKAIDIAYNTFDALMSERGDGGKIWASVLKEAIKRRNPGFNENYFGFRTFGNLLEEAQAKGLMAFGRDERSGAYVFRPSADQMATTPVMDAEMDRGLPPQDEDIDRHDAEQGDMSPLDDAEAEVKADATAHSDEAGGRSEGGSRRRGGARGGRGRSRAGTSAAVADSGAAHQAADSAPKGAPTVAAPPAAPTPPLAAQAPAPAARKPSRGGRSSRGAEAAAKPAPADVAPEAPAAKRPARKRAPAKRVKADTP